MCSNTNSPRRSKRKPKTRNFSMKQYSRKTRTKTRKPKYLNHLEENSPQTQMSLIDDDDNNTEITDTQLNLFPLHPENLVRDTQYDNVSLLFNATVEDNDHAVTLNGLLDSEVSDNCNNETATTMTSEESPLSTYGYYSTCEDHHTRFSLVRTAMKGKKERDASEEKWVVYSEVVKKREMEEVSSGGGGGSDGAWCNSSSKKKMEKLLALKLDYEEIMNAWSDKCPLYIEGGSPQTVPHLHEPNVFVDGLGSASNVWKVPELGSNLKMKEEMDGKEELIKREHRETSLLRYKEKRQNRLFYKRIRYEVRKLNAEKRPRLKGRFVKRD